MLKVAQGSQNEWLLLFVNMVHESKSGLYALRTMSLELCESQREFQTCEAARSPAQRVRPKPCDKSRVLPDARLRIPLFRLFGSFRRIGPPVALPIVRSRAVTSECTGRA